MWESPRKPWPCSVQVAGQCSGAGNEAALGSTTPSPEPCPALHAAASPAITPLPPPRHPGRRTPASSSSRRRLQRVRMRPPQPPPHAPAPWHTAAAAQAQVCIDRRSRGRSALDVNLGHVMVVPQFPLAPRGSADWVSDCLSTQGPERVHVFFARGEDSPRLRHSTANTYADSSLAACLRLLGAAQLWRRRGPQLQRRVGGLSWRLLLGGSPDTLSP